ncbi:acireductone synthase [Acidobacteriia bacterium AH_259_A11_L15]|nr:acireductone synthase [Acidobacteriia bacterium AH_259_A11_L15]
MEPLTQASARALLLDIEGTTTPIEFVYQVLFPYARAHVEEFIERHHASPDVSANLVQLRHEHDRDVAAKLNPPPWHEHSSAARLESAVAYVHWLMDRDRKATPLKSLQGKIWEAGYRSGALRSEVYPDVPPAFARWQAQQKSIAIFSSGSVLAQKLLFVHTTAGDLTRFIRAYFDTSSGAKTQAESYRRIAIMLALPPEEILFLSDVTPELDAARLAGMHIALCIRTGPPHPPTPAYPVIHTFNEIFP